MPSVPVAAWHTQTCNHGLPGYGALGQPVERRFREGAWAGCCLPRAHPGSQSVIPYPQSGSRPILSAWKWFVPLSTEIEDFGHDDESSSRTVTSSELGHDLAYRGIMPRELGRFLRRHGQSNCTRLPEEDAPDEQFGSFLDMQGAADELVATAERCVRAVGAAIGVLRLLMLGLRCIRAEYLKRLDAWASAMTASLSEATAQVLPAGPLDRARTWLRTPEGGTFLRELRWLAADRSTAVNRLRSVLRTNHSNDRLAEILMEFGSFLGVLAKPHGPSTDRRCSMSADALS